MSQPTIPERLIALMIEVEKTRYTLDCLDSTKHNSPKFDLQMAVDEQMAGLSNAFITAYSNVVRLHQIAKRALDD